MYAGGCYLGPSERRDAHPEHLYVRRFEVELPEGAVLVGDLISVPADLIGKLDPRLQLENRLRVVRRVWNKHLVGSRLGWVLYLECEDADPFRTQALLLKPLEPKRRRGRTYA